jgi:polysaccharide deacetylase family protein (PEP-CTERM system associated)
MIVKNLLTVDVEDWYHICDIEHILPPSQWDQCESRLLGNVEKILALFTRYKTKATFFILGYVAERTPEVVRIIRQEGHEIASHGYGHLQVYKQNKDEFLKDLLRSKSVIEKMIGEQVIGYRAPEWSIRKGEKDSFWAHDVLVQNGFIYDSSVAPLKFIGIPDAPTIPYTLSTQHGEIKEFPPLVKASLLGNLPVGGGWGLRILPYRWIEKTIRQMNRQRHPALLFLHPSDFDDDPPEIRLPWMKRFVCRGKIRTTEGRITRLLNDFEFTTIKNVLIEESHELHAKPVKSLPTSLYKREEKE